jgi:hypothetical protein
MQSTFEAFAPAEIAYRREHIAADFARVSRGRAAARVGASASRSAVSRALVRLHVSAGTSS